MVGTTYWLLQMMRKHDNMIREQRYDEKVSTNIHWRIQMRFKAMPPPPPKRKKQQL